MRRKLLGKYLLIFLPFIAGMTMYLSGIFNIVSSLLFFGGGYVAVKNLFDYRKRRKNRKKLTDSKVGNVMIDSSVKLEDEKVDLETTKEKEVRNINIKNEYRSYDDIPGLKRTRIYTRVRRRIK